MTLPIHFPMSLPVSSLNTSKGNPYTCTQIGIVLKLNEKAVIPFSHRCNSRIWFFKLHGPLFITHFNWLSTANLNWNSPSPTSVIVISFPIFHMDLRRFFAALKFIFLVVWNLPTRLSEQSSNKVYEQNPYFLIIT